MAAQAVLQPQLFLLEPELQGPERLGRAKISEIYVKQILTKGSGSIQSYDYTLNPYIGCGFGCSYCFASFFQAEQERFDSWGTWIEIKANAADVLRAKRDLKGKSIFMSSATDPYQPLEAKVELTRKLVEIMSGPIRQPRLTVQTRGPLVTRDLDLFKRFTNIRVNMSITTDCDEIRKEFEPGCASIERRLEALAQVKAAGIRTSAVLAPMLPLRDPEAFAKKLKAINADFYCSAFFIKSDRPFASSTRDGAWKLAKKYGWTKDGYMKAAAALKKHLPQLNGGGGFQPA